MIPKISAYNPNFKGNVRIGRNREEREQISESILKIPEDSREYFIDSINTTKAVLAARTPRSVNLTMHLENYNSEKGRFQGISIDVTDDNVGSAVVVGKAISLSYVFDGEENDYFSLDADDKFAELRESVLKNVTVINIPKQPEGVPKTTDEVLGRLA